MITINKTIVNKLRGQLAQRLQQGCVDAALILRDNTPIDTKRLWSTTRADEVVTDGDYLSCRIVAGGENVPGILRETDIKRDVDYAIFVESRTNYARETLNDIKNVLIDNLEK